MEGVAPLKKRTQRAINANRRRLLREAYERYPEYAYCDPEDFNWREAEARSNIFDLYYLADSGYLDVTRGSAEMHRTPDFYMLTPQGADLIETPDRSPKSFPCESGRERKENPDVIEDI